MLSLNINILINEFDLFFWLVYIFIAMFDIYRTLPDENMIIYLISGLNKIKTSNENEDYLFGPNPAIFGSNMNGNKIFLAASLRWTI
jgi:hypothetical protein